jgi:hypothetical protein
MKPSLWLMPFATSLALSFLLASCGPDIKDRRVVIANDALGEETTLAPELGQGDTSNIKDSVGLWNSGCQKLIGDDVEDSYQSTLDLRANGTYTIAVKSFYFGECDPAEYIATFRIVGTYSGGTETANAKTIDFNVGGLSVEMSENSANELNKRAAGRKKVICGISTGANTANAQVNGYKWVANKEIDVSDYGCQPGGEVQMSGNGIQKGDQRFDIYEIIDDKLHLGLDVANKNSENDGSSPEKRPLSVSETAYSK